MAGYVIYVPGATGCTKHHLCSVGLGDIADEPGLTFLEVLHDGPDGGAGMLHFWDYPHNRDRVPQTGMRPSEQTWIPSPQNGDLPAGRYWLGFETSRPVRPEDVQRKKMHAGGDVILADGQAWHIPMARQLPHLLGIGKPRIRDQYKPFFDLAMTAVNTWLYADDSGPQWRVSWAAGYAFCCVALGQNYRINAEIADMLGLIETDSLGPIVETATNGKWDARLAELAGQKKTSLSDSSDIAPTSSGDPA